MSKIPLKLYSVSPRWSQFGVSRYHHVVAATDPIGAARGTFNALKLENNRRWQQGQRPVEYEVWRVMTPEEFQENIEHAPFDDESDGENTPYQAFSDAFLMEKVMVKL